MKVSPTIYGLVVHPPPYIVFPKNADWRLHTLHASLLLLLRRPFSSCISVILFSAAGELLAQLQALVLITTTAPFLQLRLPLIPRETALSLLILH